jgi:kinesin family protein 1
MEAKVIVSMSGAKTTLVDPSGATPPRDFTFDFSYWSFDSAAPNFATNPKVYSDLGVSVLNNAWEGYNCCLFAYGQTGAGKSKNSAPIHSDSMRPSAFLISC